MHLIWKSCLTPVYFSFLILSIFLPLLLYPRFTFTCLILFFVAFDCYDIGEVIFEQEYNRLALQWFQTSLSKVKDIDVTKTNITEFLFNLNKKLYELKRHVSSGVFCSKSFCLFVLVFSCSINDILLPFLSTFLLIIGGQDILSQPPNQNITRKFKTWTPFLSAYVQLRT